MVDDTRGYKRRVYWITTTAIVFAAILLVVLFSSAPTKGLILVLAFSSPLVALVLWLRFKNEDVAKRFAPALKMKIMATFLVAVTAMVWSLDLSPLAFWILLGASLLCFFVGTLVLAVLAKRQTGAARK